MTSRFNSLGGVIGMYVALNATVALLSAASMLGIYHAYARDNGQYVNSPDKAWVESLQNKTGYPCCSDADGKDVEDIQWDMRDGHYRVFIAGQWVIVPDDAIVTQHNRRHHAMVWTFQNVNGEVLIRCFLPGPQA